MKFSEMDERTTLREQMQTADGPIVLINRFTVSSGDTDAFIEAWQADASFMRLQPGFISTQLHRGVGESGVFVNYAVWESATAFARAFAQPDFQAGLTRYPETAVAEPHLFKKIAVPGICLE
jgi:heme-degrading monooxygenase HmoA